MNKFSFINYDADLVKKKSFNILIIDDDESVASSLKEYMECRGHNVTVVDEGSRGITHSYLKHYDIIFLDYHLDNDISVSHKNKNKQVGGNYLDGVAVTQCIKEDIKNTKKTIIFAYTGDTSTEAICNFKEAGMDGVIFKPIDINALDKIMSSLENKSEVDKLFLTKISKQYNRSLMVFWKK